jgi:hypothetical protein
MSMTELVDAACESSAEALVRKCVELAWLARSLREPGKFMLWNGEWMRPREPLGSKLDAMLPLLLRES